MTPKNLSTPPFRKLTEAQLLALCIYGEARGESREGKIAVASVIKQRVKEGGWYGLGWHGVILKPKQFSCFNTSDPNYPKLFDIANDFARYCEKSKAMSECYEIARGIVGDTIRPNVVATNYKTTNCRGGHWSESMVEVKQIGNHLFYI